MVLLQLLLAATASAAATQESHRIGWPTFDVLAHGAKGDGSTDDTAAIDAAFAACRAAAGGTVLFRAGHTFLSGPIELACNDSVTVVEPGALLRARNTTAGWPFGPDCPEPAQGMSPRQAAPMLLISFGRNVSLEGGGVVDANGEMWWANACGNEWCPTPHKPIAFRPFHFRIDHSVGVRVQNISLKNAGFWTLVPVHSSRVQVIGVNISAAWTKRPAHWAADRHDLLDTPNTDGIGAASVASF
jgi:polygalacturonase